MMATGATNKIERYFLLKCSAIFADNYRQVKNRGKVEVTQEQVYRQILSVRSLVYAIQGRIEESEAIRYYLRKNYQKEKTVEFPEAQSAIAYKKSA